ncbi:MAG: class I SAM-dependent methyltransferase [Gemmataceae bacterium]|nr:class I SAM-dependent methyltransferase [Gemmataceae bacterium]
MSNDRIQREQHFHNQRFGGDDGARARAGKYYSIMGSAVTCYKNIVLKYCKGKQLLEYGCGTGSLSTVWEKHGGVVTGIDISAEGIKKATAIGLNNGIHARYYVMNAEQLEFPDASFDIIVGSAILHHLDLKKAYSELSRVLKPGGHAVFLEPLGHNVLINLYRRLTPSMRTVDEHPLTERDIDFGKHYFTEVHCRYFGLFSLLSVPFSKTGLFRMIRNSLELLDGAAISCFPFIGKYAWMVVLHLSRPIK